MVNHPNRSRRAKLRRWIALELLEWETSRESHDALADRILEKILGSDPSQAERVELKEPPK